MPSPVYRGEMRAPEFPTGLEWFNTRPITLAALRGKIVLLDFWASSCINCRHLLAQLARLKEKHGDSLAVIGVHTARFAAEKNPVNVLEAMFREEIGHPVVSDADSAIWESYSVHAWPTLVLIDPDGNVIGKVSGDGACEAMSPVVASIAADFGGRGLLRPGPIPVPVVVEVPRDERYSFPGKVLADEAGGRLFIADTNKNRIVVTRLAEGRVLDIVSGGPAGFADGGFEEARLHHPQGMAVDGDRLYFADRDNHAVRVANLSARTVTTLVGTGRPAPPADEPLRGPGREVALNAPWDLVLVRGLLFVAMAGSHQIWTIDPENGEARPHAGTGSEARIDGPLRMASLAQPSGITTDGERLYVVDSESSSVRAIDLDPGGDVDTIVGLDLFEFGDADGAGEEVRLQHPLGVAWKDGILYIADTYNNKIKRLDLESGRCETLFGSGESGFEDNEDGRFALLNDPGGVSAAGDLLYIADTHNHAIRVASLTTGTLLTFVVLDLNRFEFPSA